MASSVVAHLVRRTLVQRIVLRLHRPPRAGEDGRCVALGHEAARAHGAAGGQQVTGALGPQPVGLGEVTREVAQVDRVRDGGELVHDHFGLGLGDCASDRVRVERVRHHWAGAEVTEEVALRGRAGHAHHVMSSRGEPGK